MLPFLSKAAVDLYYIGYFDAAATYNSGSELRHTLGTRFFGSQPIGPGMLDSNYESMLQFGSFDSQPGNGSILAWSIGTEQATRSTLSPSRGFPCEPTSSAETEALTPQIFRRSIRYFPRGNTLANSRLLVLTISSICLARSV